MWQSVNIFDQSEVFYLSTIPEEAISVQHSFLAPYARYVFSYCSICAAELKTSVSFQAVIQLHI